MYIIVDCVHRGHAQGSVSLRPEVRRRRDEDVHADARQEVRRQDFPHRGPDPRGPGGGVPGGHDR